MISIMVMVSRSWMGSLLLGGKSFSSGQFLVAVEHLVR